MRSGVVAKRRTISVKVLLYGERFSGRCWTLSDTSRTGGITACEFQSGIVTILYSLLVDARWLPSVEGWPMVGPMSSAGRRAVCGESRRTRMNRQQESGSESRFDRLNGRIDSALV